MVLALAIHCWNCWQLPAWSSMVILVLLWRCEPQFVIHYAYYFMHVMHNSSLSVLCGFSLGVTWGIWRSNSCYSFLSNCDTSWRASQLSVIHATVMLSLGAGGSGSSWWVQELSNSAAAVVRDVEVKWEVSSHAAASWQTHSRTLPNMDWLCLHGASSWRSFLCESCSTELPSGRPLWVSLLNHIFSKCWFSPSCGVPVVLS